MHLKTLTDGVWILCRFCGRKHKIKGYKGNNIHWEDKNGWSGSFDIAHGIFSSMRGCKSVCPQCSSMSIEERARLLDVKADRLLNQQKSEKENRQ